MTDQNSRIIIIGSGGFISSELEKILKKNKKNFLGLKRKKINLLSKSRSKILKKVIKKGDKVIFIASKAPVKTLDQFTDNIIMLNNFCKNIDPNKINKIIYLSSDAVYSDTKKKINESSLTFPTSLHANMHLQREIILKNIFKNKLLIIRPTLVYGEKDPHNGYGPNLFIRNFLSEKNIFLYGRGEERRDHIWVNDLANIIYKSIFKKFNGILNVASGEVISFYEIAKLIKSIKNNNKINISFKKRIGPMHHLGLRCFDITLLKKKFKDSQPKKIRQVLKKIYKNYEI